MHFGFSRLIVRVRESRWIGPYGEAEPNEGTKISQAQAYERRKRKFNAEVILIALSAWLTIGRCRYARNALRAAIVLPAYLE